MAPFAALNSTVSPKHGVPEDRLTASRLCHLPSDRGREGRKSTGIHLTSRQLQVLSLLCQGLPNKLICRRLGISGGTVKAHVSSILGQLGVTSRLQAVVEARRQRLMLDEATTQEAAPLNFAQPRLPEARAKTKSN